MLVFFLNYSKLLKLQEQTLSQFAFEATCNLLKAVSVPVHAQERNQLRALAYCHSTFILKKLQCSSPFSRLVKRLLLQFHCPTSIHILAVNHI